MKGLKVYTVWVRLVGLVTRTIRIEFTTQSSWVELDRGVVFFYSYFKKSYLSTMYYINK